MLAAVWPGAWGQPGWLDETFGHWQLTLPVRGVLLCRIRRRPVASRKDARPMLSVATIAVCCISDIACEALDRYLAS